MEHERLLIENFVYKERQDRYLNLIQTKTGRTKLRKYIAHFNDLDSSFLINVSHLQTFQDLYSHLKSKGAADTCYIISEHSDYDGCSFPLFKGISYLFNSGISYFSSIIAGKLVYYEGEEANQKLILLK